MPTSHDMYPSILVYDGKDGEKAQAGAFYLPKKGDTMLKLAGMAWGSKYSKLKYARRINANPWNKMNLTYRNSDWNCNAKVVPSEGAEKATFGGGPWIALNCPIQAIWIPEFGKFDDVPGEYVEPPIVKAPGFKAAPPTYRAPGLKQAPGIPSVTVTKPGGRVTGPAPDTSESVQAGIIPKSNKGKIVLGLVIAGLLVAGYAWSRRKKKGR